MASIVSLFIVLSFTGCTVEEIDQSSSDINFNIVNSADSTNDVNKDKEDDVNSQKTVDTGSNQEDDSKGNGDD